MPNKKPTFISLFSGGGGFKLGFENVGFECLLATDIMPEAKKTNDLNGRIYYERSISTRFPKNISSGLKQAMPGLDMSEIPPESRLQERGW